MRPRKQIERDTEPMKGAVTVPIQLLLGLILEVLLDIRAMRQE